MSPHLALQTGAHDAHLGDPWTVWTGSPLVTLALGLVTVLYLIGWWRLRRRGRPDLANVPRALSFLLGIDILNLALTSPLDHVAHHYLLSVHMVQHVLIGDVAPILLTLGVAGPLALFVVPRPILRASARPRIRAVLRVVCRPWVAFVAWSVVTCAWYIPAAYAFALGNPWGHAAMQTSIILTGLGVWAHIIGTVPRMRMSHARRAGYALGLLAVGMVLSQVLFLADPLYATYIDQPQRLFGLSPGADQIRAALIMSGEQIITILLAATLLMWTHVHRVAAELDTAAEASPGTR